MLSKSVRVNRVEHLQILGSLPQPVDTLFYAALTDQSLTQLLSQPCLTVVGSRKITPYGKAVTIQLVKELVRAGIVIISGLALGVDATAHQACLDAGGRTIAVLPAGLDTIYPAQHRSLAERIVSSGGALLSEYAPGHGSPQKFQFIARNRIMAALSRGVLITEAASKSGSLHTAHFALEQGTEVFAVPGNITSPTSEGTNQLIKQGAHPVTHAQDILEILHIQPQQQLLPSRQNREEATILQAIRSTDGRLASILHHTGLSAATFQQHITLLEIAGDVQQVGPNAWMAT